MVLNSKQDQAPQQPTAAVSGLIPRIGASNTGSSPTPFRLATAPGPLAADRCSIVRGCSRPPSHLGHRTAPQLLPTVTAAGGGSFHPTWSMAPRGAVPLEDTCSHDRSRRAPASTACKAAASRRLRSVGEIPGLRTRRRRARRLRVTPLFSGVPARRAREFGAFFLGELARCGGVQGLPSCGRDIAGAVPIPDLPAGASARQWGGVGSAPAGLGCSATRASAR